MELFALAVYFRLSQIQLTRPKPAGGWKVIKIREVSPLGEKGEYGRAATRHLGVERTHVIEFLLECRHIGKTRRDEILKVVAYGVTPRRYGFTDNLVKMAIGLAARDVMVGLGGRNAALRDNDNDVETFELGHVNRSKDIAYARSHDGTAVDEEGAIGTDARSYLAQAVERDVEMEEVVERLKDKSRIGRTATKACTVWDDLIKH